ncbi:hypothetical protein HMPREF3190_01183 [Umbribacter vaginalis]|nr:hypothetical protein HMPREF3190_01183 [Coriobacteriales bacterium DNF00809]
MSTARTAPRKNETPRIIRGAHLQECIENAAVILQSCNYVAVTHNEYRITSINYAQLVWQLYRQRAQLRTTTPQLRSSNTATIPAACATPHHCTAAI